MRTYLECIPCFFRQAIEAARLSGADEAAQKKIIDEVAGAIPSFSLEASPPEMARIIHGAVKKHTGVNDPYAEVKNKSNTMALAVYDELVNKVNRADDKLLKAVEIAIAGNIIDFGVKNTLDVQGEIDKILQKEDETIAVEEKDHFEYIAFKKVVEEAKTILFLGDNAGETVFDRVLIERIKCISEAKIFYAVKERAIINDALREDAEFAGIGDLAEIISSGSDAPGTVLDICSKEFMDLYGKADMVISKGQGNFEALSDPGRSIFYLFMAKCQIVARSIGCNVGDIILSYI